MEGRVLAHLHVLLTGLRLDGILVGHNETGTGEMTTCTCMFGSIKLNEDLLVFWSWWWTLEVAY